MNLEINDPVFFDTILVDNIAVLLMCKGGKQMRSYKSLIAKSLLIASIIFGALGATASPVQAATVNNALPVDTSAVTEDDGTTQTADANKVATSNVTVDILSGILTLNAVPDFAFGSTMIGSSSKLVSNDVDTTDTDAPLGEDGSSEGVVKMIDSRTQTTKDGMATGPGFSLTASIGNLVHGTSELGAILTLSSMPLVDQNDQNVSINSAKDFKTTKGVLQSGGPAQQLINLQGGTYRAGVIRAHFSTPDSASLEVPNQTNTAPSNSVTKYNAVVTWTLNAAPVVK